MYVCMYVCIIRVCEYIYIYISIMHLVLECVCACVRICACVHVCAWPSRRMFRRAKWHRHALCIVWAPVIEHTQNTGRVETHFKQDRHILSNMQAQLAIQANERKRNRRIKKESFTQFTVLIPVVKVGRFIFLVFMYYSARAHVRCMCANVCIVSVNTCMCTHERRKQKQSGSCAL